MDKLGGTHPIGILSFQMFLTSGGLKSEISVRMYPGETELALAKPTHSMAKLLPVPPSRQQQVHPPRPGHHLHMCMTADFDALYAVCSCGKLAMCPLMLAVATKLPYE